MIVGFGLLPISIQIYLPFSVYGLYVTSFELYFSKFIFSLCQLINGLRPIHEIIKIPNCSIEKATLGHHKNCSIRNTMISTHRSYDVLCPIGKCYKLNSGNKYKTQTCDLKLVKHTCCAFGIGFSLATIMQNKSLWSRHLLQMWGINDACAHIFCKQHNSLLFGLILKAFQNWNSSASWTLTDCNTCVAHNFDKIKVLTNEILSHTTLMSWTDKLIVD